MFLVNSLGMNIDSYVKSITLPKFSSANLSVWIINKYSYIVQEAHKI